MNEKKLPLCSLCLFFMLFIFSCKTKPPVSEIEFIEPGFEIVSIIILQADLVNTKFETALKIDNPNNFDLELSSIKYELHGNGMLWAEGSADNMVVIPAQKSAQTKFSFSMNFINMNRRLLDDVIEMRRVQYAFKGEAVIFAENFPPTPVKFNISGLSDVKPKAENESQN